MPENDSTPGTPRRKSKKAKHPATPTVQTEGHLPLIRSGEVYSREGFLSRMEMSPATFRRWIDLGFRAPRPGTKRQLIIADDAIEFIRQHPNLDEEDEA